MGEGQETHDLGPVIAAEEEERVMQSLMKDVGVEGFAMAVLTHDATEGKAYAIQCAGLGPLTPNTVLMGCTGWFGESARRIILEENHFIATGFNMSEGSGLNVLGNGLPSVKDNALLRNVDIGNRELAHPHLASRCTPLDLTTNASC